jgi:hypothetical protein
VRKGEEVIKKSVVANSGDTRASNTPAQAIKAGNLAAFYALLAMPDRLAKAFAPNPFHDLIFP